MEQTIVTLTLHGPGGAEQVEGLADTAATFSKVPGVLARRIGLRPELDFPVELADGRTVVRHLALAHVEIAGVRRPVLVALGAEGEQSLIGYTTLEMLGFKVNAVTHQLEPATPIEY